MRRSVVKTALLVSVFIIGLSSHKSYSQQFDDVGKLLTGGIADAQKLADAYLSPFTNAFGATLNAGWYNTARPHSVLGFDLTLSLNVAIIPDEAKFFYPRELGLTSEDLNIDGPLTSPTAAGATDVERPRLQYVETVDGEPVVRGEFTLPEGTGLGYIPAPTLQLGIGLPLGTDIIGRFVPRIGFEDVGDIGLWGIGIKHSLKQWIPGVKRLPVLNLSVMAGYTSFYTKADLDFIPGDIDAEDRTSPMVSWDNQKLDFSVGSFTANIMASADIPFITGYLGLGINSTNTNLKMTGWYPVPAVDEITSQIEVTDDSALLDPIDFRLGGNDGGVQPRITAGFKLKLSVLHIHFDYTYSNYSIATAGLGFSFR